MKSGLPLVVLALLLGAVPALAQQEPVTFRPLTSFKITGLTTATDSTSASIKAFEQQTRWARVVCTADCLIAFQVTPANAALSAPMFLPSTTPEYFIVPAGGYVRVRADSLSGTLWVTEMGR